MVSSWSPPARIRKNEDQYGLHLGGQDVSTLFKVTVTFLLVVLLATSVYAINLFARKASVSWVPGDFNPYSGDSGLAWKEASSRNGFCLSGGGCIGIDIIANRDCRNMVYLEANIFDSRGAVIGYTNDSLGSLSKFQTGKLQLDIRNGIAFQITKINCL